MEFSTSSIRDRSSNSSRRANQVRIILEKIRIPEPGSTFPRRRLEELLEKQLEQFGTSLVLGRAGTGKSTVACDLAKNYKNVAWFRVEATDIDWDTFSQYLSSSFQKFASRLAGRRSPDQEGENLETRVLKYLQELFAELELKTVKAPLLVVLDDLHCVFDAEWFETFFKGLLSYQLPTVQFLLLSRSKPPFPLWRLRSKQKLGVIDESLLLFTHGELEQFLTETHREQNDIRSIHRESYGRISKILELLSD
ncbi:MAG: hypothetical protein KIS76_03685 [Pyrinomonadaceae bacterium]|nr:hypothetical protein [Pyrinomonadaceae bacterium]